MADFDDMVIFEQGGIRKKKLHDDKDKYLLPELDETEQTFDENM